MHAPEETFDPGLGKNELRNKLTMSDCIVEYGIINTLASKLVAMCTARQRREELRKTAFRATKLLSIFRFD